MHMIDARFLPTLLRRLHRDERGIQLVEFAMAIPVLLTLGLGGIEVANYSIASIRCSQIAMSVADNAGRVRDSIDEADIHETMIGAKQMGEGVKFVENARIILSSLEPNAAKTGQYIRWQRCVGKKVVQSLYGVEGKGENDASLQGMGPAATAIKASAGTAVMFVEVVYDYQPIVSNRLLGTRTMRYESAFNVRQRTDQKMKNGGSLPVLSCNTYNS
jgi:hypothetical protein